MYARQQETDIQPNFFELVEQYGQSSALPPEVTLQKIIQAFEWNAIDIIENFKLPPLPYFQWNILTILLQIFIIKANKNNEYLKWLIVLLYKDTDAETKNLLNESILFKKEMSIALEDVKLLAINNPDSLQIIANYFPLSLGITQFPLPEKEISEGLDMLNEDVTELFDITELLMSGNTNDPSSSLLSLLPIDKAISSLGSSLPNDASSSSSSEKSEDFTSSYHESFPQSVLPSSLVSYSPSLSSSPSGIDYFTPPCHDSFPQSSLSPSSLASHSPAFNSQSRNNSRAPIPYTNMLSLGQPQVAQHSRLPLSGLVSRSPLLASQSRTNSRTPIPYPNMPSLGQHQVVQHSRLPLSGLVSRSPLLASQSSADQRMPILYPHHLFLDQSQVTASPSTVSSNTQRTSMQATVTTEQYPEIKKQNSQTSATSSSTKRRRNRARVPGQNSRRKVDQNPDQVSTTCRTQRVRRRQPLLTYINTLSLDDFLSLPDLRNRENELHTYTKREILITCLENALYHGRAKSYLTALCDENHLMLIENLEYYFNSLVNVDKFATELLTATKTALYKKMTEPKFKKIKNLLSQEIKPIILDISILTFADYSDIKGPKDNPLVSKRYILIELLNNLDQPGYREKAKELFSSLTEKNINLISSLYTAFSQSNNAEALNLINLTKQKFLFFQQDSLELNEENVKSLREYIAQLDETGFQQHPDFSSRVYSKKVILMQLLNDFETHHDLIIKFLNTLDSKNLPLVKNLREAYANRIEIVALLDEALKRIEPVLLPSQPQSSNPNSFWQFKNAALYRNINAMFQGVTFTVGVNAPKKND